MINVSIIGSGNVANYFASQFIRSGIQINGVWSHNTEHAISFASEFGANRVEHLSDFVNFETDLILIAVKDDSIRDIAEQLPKGKLVVHTSGFTDINTLTEFHSRSGVFYPLQTISKASRLEPEMVPIMLESSNSSDLNLLQELCVNCGFAFYNLNSEKRKMAHLAAVFINNFSNHLAFIAQKLIEENQLDFAVLKPLILETANKLQYLNPADSQTGPALRGDDQTMKSHLKLLESHPEFKELYRLMSDLIINSKRK